jgi:hypothetical protein
MTKKKNLWSLLKDQAERKQAKKEIHQEIMAKKKFVKNPALIYIETLPKQTLSEQIEERTPSVEHIVIQPETRESNAHPESCEKFAQSGSCEVTQSTATQSCENDQSSTPIIDTEDTSTIWTMKDEEELKLILLTKGIRETYETFQNSYVNDIPPPHPVDDSPKSGLQGIKQILLNKMMMNTDEITDYCLHIMENHLKDTQSFKAKLTILTDKTQKYLRLINKQKQKIKKQKKKIKKLKKIQIKPPEKPVIRIVTVGRKPTY